MAGDADPGVTGADLRTPEQRQADLQQLNRVLNDEVVRLRKVRDHLVEELAETKTLLSRAEARALPRHRKRMPKTRPSLTHDFEVGGLPGYLTIGLREDKSMGEFFLTLSKQGSTLDGFSDSFARCASLALQWGMPLESLVEKFKGYSFEPSGCTDNPALPMAKSVVDYVVRYLEREFLPGAADDKQDPELIPSADVSAVPKKKAPRGSAKVVTGPACPECGNMTRRSGSCYACSCGATTGCS